MARAEHHRRRSLDHTHLVERVERERQPEAIVAALTAHPIDENLAELAADVGQAGHAESVGAIEIGCDARQIVHIDDAETGHKLGRETGCRARRILETAAVAERTIEHKFTR